MEGELSLWAHPQKLQSRCLLEEANVFSPALLPKISRKDIKSCLFDLEAILLIGPRAIIPLLPHLLLWWAQLFLLETSVECFFCPLVLDSHSTRWR